MITESQQILACAQKDQFGKVSMLKVDGEPFKTPESRMNHPVVKWACISVHNMKFLSLYLQSLLDKYEGDKFKNVPVNLDILNKQLVTGIYYRHSPFLNFAKADDKDLDFTHIENVFEAYDLFLKAQGA
jgi:hypothetical protein